MIDHCPIARAWISCRQLAGNALEKYRHSSRA